MWIGPEQMLCWYCLSCVHYKQQGNNNMMQNCGFGNGPFLSPSFHGKRCWKEVLVKHTVFVNNHSMGTEGEVKHVFWWCSWKTCKCSYAFGMLPFLWLKINHILFLNISSFIYLINFFKSLCPPSNINCSNEFTINNNQLPTTQYNKVVMDQWCCKIKMHKESTDHWQPVDAKWRRLPRQQGCKNERELFMVSTANCSI